MLLKIAYHDFLDDRRFKKTTKTNIKNYVMLPGKFVDYCIENQVVNVEDISYSPVRQYLLKCQEKVDKALKNERALSQICIVYRQAVQTDESLLYTI